MNVLSPSMPLYGMLSLFRTSFPFCYAFPCVSLGCDVSTCKPYTAVLKKLLLNMKKINKCHQVYSLTVYFWVWRFHRHAMTRVNRAEEIGGNLFTSISSTFQRLSCFDSLLRATPAVSCSFQHFSVPLFASVIHHLICLSIFFHVRVPAVFSCVSVNMFTLNRLSSSDFSVNFTERSLVNVDQFVNVNCLDILVIVFSLCLLTLFLFCVFDVCFQESSDRKRRLRTRILAVTAESFLKIDKRTKRVSGRRVVNVVFECHGNPGLVRVWGPVGHIFLQVL